MNHYQIRTQNIGTIGGLRVLTMLSELVAYSSRNRNQLPALITLAYIIEDAQAAEEAGQKVNLRELMRASEILGRLIQRLSSLSDGIAGTDAGLGGISLQLQLAVVAEPGAVQGHLTAALKTLLLFLESSPSGGYEMPELYR